MYIKQAYERRIQQEIRNQSTSYLKIKQKSPAIGSIKTGKIQFDRQQAFFSESDVPQKSKFLKSLTKQFKDPDILQLKKQKWNISVESPRKFDKFEDSHKDVLFKIKHGFLDFDKTLQEKPKKIYPGVDTRNNYQGWNVSTEVTKKQKKENIHNLTLASLENTISFNQSMLKNYQKPIQRFNKQRSEQKQKYINDSVLMMTLKQQYLSFFIDRYQHHNPNASPEKTKASVFKLLQQTRRNKLKETLFINQDQLQISRRFKANLSDSQKINISIKFVHNGIWSQVPWAQNGYAWSCCMNQEVNGKGCVKKVIDSNRPNFSSFNNS